MTPPLKGRNTDLVFMHLSDNLKFRGAVQCAFFEDRLPVLTWCHCMQIINLLQSSFTVYIVSHTDIHINAALTTLVFRNQLNLSEGPLSRWKQVVTNSAQSGSIKYGIPGCLEVSTG